jgi:hypothetical protein
MSIFVVDEVALDKFLSDFRRFLPQSSSFITSYSCPMKHVMALERQDVIISSGFSLKLLFLWLLSNVVHLIGSLGDTGSSWDRIEPKHRMISQ